MAILCDSFSHVDASSVNILMPATKKSPHPTKAVVLSGDKSLVLVRRLIYLYAILWIIEGALRKWILPGLSDVLLIIRDPLVIIIYAVAITKGKFPVNGLVISGAVLAVLSFITSVAMGHGNLGVAIFGVRTMVLHVPLLFLIPRVMDERHVRVIARATLWVVIPMTVLLVLQFLSPTTAWVNKGLGGVGTAGFTGALGRMRPPGTFSFIMGPILLYPFATAAWFITLLAVNRLSPLLLISGAAIVLAGPISISRSLLLNCLLVLSVAVVALLSLGTRHAAMMLRAFIAAAVAGVIAMNIGVFKEGTAAFGDRWSRSTTQAGGVQVAIIDRFLGAFTEPLKIGFDAPIFGYGIGAGTNAGSKLLIGKAFFIAGESEPGRLVMENGIFLGWAWLVWRILLMLVVLKASLSAWKTGNKIPLIIFTSCGLTLFIGQWGQATALGFGILVGGLCLAACQLVNETSGTKTPVRGSSDSRSLAGTRSRVVP